VLYLGAVAELSHALPGGGRIQMLGIAGISVALGLIRMPAYLRPICTLAGLLIFVAFPVNAQALSPPGPAGLAVVYVAYFLLPMLIGASLTRLLALMRSEPQPDELD
jgi:hypothetical protein